MPVKYYTFELTIPKFVLFKIFKHIRTSLINNKKLIFLFIDRCFNRIVINKNAYNYGKR